MSHLQSDDLSEANGRLAMMAIIGMCHGFGAGVLGLPFFWCMCT